MAEAVVPLVKPKNVRKWRRMLMAIADTTVEPPTTFFNATTHLPTPLTTGFKDMGYVTTDGITQTDELSTEDTEMLQDLVPVRTDLTGRKQSLQVAFGEGTPWVNALWHGLPVSSWPATNDGPWLYDDASVTEFPPYRIWLIGQDGLGANAIYRAEFAYKAVLIKKTDRALGSKAETYGCTFGLYLDDELAIPSTRGQNGPSLNIP